LSKDWYKNLSLWGYFLNNNKLTDEPFFLLSQSHQKAPCLQLVFNGVILLTKPMKAIDNLYPEPFYAILSASG
jgi:hypothetical protein